MARKKKHPEHENLERWLVSYADFMTLLFATFVVLYALSQIDAADFSKLEEALRKAFESNVFDGQESIMESSDSILDGAQGSTTPIMLEYLSPKYEEGAFQEIKNEVDNLKIDGIEASIDERGLVIKLADNLMTFKSGSAEINPDSLGYLDTVANIIKEHFARHIIRVEGHTDSDPVSNPTYPSNWELSSARASSIVRYFIDYHQYNPKLFIATGYADTAPVAKGNTNKDKVKNRRVEIVILKNKLRDTNSKSIDDILKERNKQKELSPAAKELVGDDKKLMKNVIDFKQVYTNESLRIDKVQNSDYEQTQMKPDFLE